MSEMETTAKRKTALDAQRGTYFVVEPESLKIIEDKRHPLYDSRVELPLDDDFVESIAHFGVKKIIDVRKNGDRLEVVDGRRRTRGAVEANRRREERGLPRLTVRVVLEKGTDEDMDLLMVLGNRGRVDDDPVTLAEKAARLVAKVGEERAALACCTNVRTLRSWLQILDLAPEIRESVRRGDLKYSAATKLAALPREEQQAALAEAAASGDGAGATIASVREAVERKKSPEKSAAKVRLSDSRDRLLAVVLGWDRGEEKLEDVKEAAREFAAAARALEKKAAKK